MSDSKTYDPGSARLLLVGSVISITLAAFAALAVTTIMPRVAVDLGDLSLYPLAFGMALAGQLIGTAVAGTWCDARGPAWSLILGMLLFISGLAVCGLAPTMQILVAGRTLQGLGGGFLMVPMYVLVGSLVPPRHRPRFFAAFAAAWVIPALVGPAIAGFIIEWFSWRSIFLALIPLISVTAVFMLPLLRKLPKVCEPLRPRSRRTMAGAAAAGGAVALIQIGSTTNMGRVPIGDTWLPVATIIFVGGGISILVFSLSYIFPPGTTILRRGIPSLVASRGAVNAAFVATEAFLPLILQNGHGWSPKASGMVITVGSLTWAVGSFLQSRVADDQLRLRLPTLGGTAMTIGVLVTGAAAFPQVPPLITAVGWGIAGLGCGLSYPALAVLALAATPDSKHGWVSSSLQLADSMGGAAALAAISGVFAWASFYPPPWPFIPGPAIAAVLATVAAIAGARLLHPGELSVQLHDGDY